jgi:hypothetical protein
MTMQTIFQQVFYTLPDFVLMVFLYIFDWSRPQTMVKYKCFKIQCPVCRRTGSCQTFLNKQNKITYARVRHYSHINKQTKKPQFEYHKIQNLEALKTLLNASYSTGKADKVQGGQGYTANNVDPKHLSSRLNFEMAGPLGFEPRTFSLEG